MTRAASLFGIVLIFAAGGADWPQFRGPTGTQKGSARTGYDPIKSKWPGLKEYHITMLHTFSGTQVRRGEGHARGSTASDSRAR